MPSHSTATSKIGLTTPPLRMNRPHQPSIYKQERAKANTFIQVSVVLSGGHVQWFVPAKLWQSVMGTGSRATQTLASLEGSFNYPYGDEAKSRCLDLYKLVHHPTTRTSLRSSVRQCHILPSPKQVIGVVVLKTLPTMPMSFNVMKDDESCKLPIEVAFYTENLNLTSAKPIFSLGATLSISLHHTIRCAGGGILATYRFEWPGSPSHIVGLNEDRRFQKVFQGCSIYRPFPVVQL